ncbi:gntP family permease domain-containing protein [Ditylenchus destructor]|uniref:GntP family permease domain-containing protein n=1 Tax=Ditylenchus destructor TaxID=166010 RepID=A0AAD4QRM9_9BILA|nr:gntP family permease domain-containing protein [Ditylenchus destructor]
MRFFRFYWFSILSGLCLGIAPDQLVGTFEKGIAGVMGSLTLIIVLGAMLGKIVAESGAAEIIAVQMVRLMGRKPAVGPDADRFCRWDSVVLRGWFRAAGTADFSISYRYKLPAVYIGLPMLAALSVTHGFIPPHPSPVALVALFHADMGLTLIYGLLIAFPAIVLGGPIFGRRCGICSRVKNQSSGRKKTVDQQVYKQPAVGTSLSLPCYPFY